MIDLKNCTFIIPIRIESEDRMRNVVTVLAYLLKNFDTKVIVKEVDVVITCLPSPKICSDVMLSENGILKNISKGNEIINTNIKAGKILRALLK